MGLIKDLKKTCKDQAAEIRWLKQQKTLLLGRREDLKAKLEREQLREAQAISVMGALFCMLGKKEVKVPYSVITEPTAYDLMVTKNNDTEELTLVMVKKEDNPS